MSLDPALLFLSLLTGGVGFVLLVYGKKEGRWPYLVAGLLFLVYPYFLDTAAAVVAVGLALGAALWFAVRQGY